MENCNCINCYSEISKKECISCDNNHDMCQECFETQVHSQISQESIGEFANNLCKITCKYCSTKNTFTDKKVIANISENLCEQFFKIKEDILTRKAEIEYEKRHCENISKSKIEQHCNFICENILTLHCTNKKCNTAIFDFNGCFAIECASCKSNLCAWCLGDYSPDAHQHVKTCKYSLNPGSVFGTFEQFNKIHIKKKNYYGKKIFRINL